jgi:hypothetical protein
LVQFTQTGKMLIGWKRANKFSKWQKNMLHDKKYTVILLSKAFQNIPKLVFLVYKNIASGNPVWTDRWEKRFSLAVMRTLIYSVYPSTLLSESHLQVWRMTPTRGTHTRMDFPPPTPDTVVFGSKDRKLDRGEIFLSNHSHNQTKSCPIHKSFWKLEPLKTV